jgi:hypothetical protein
MDHRDPCGADAETAPTGAILAQRPTFATFYTDDRYRALARRLARCCVVFGLRFLAIQGQDHGSWRRNCNQKPRLLELLRSRVPGPIVWLDADCVIHQPPTLFQGDLSCDAVLWRGGRSGDKRYIGSQVMLWNDTPRARAMIATWAELSCSRPDSLADPLLKQVCDVWVDRARIDPLPDTYRSVYWAPAAGLVREAIVISCNERASQAPDALPLRRRERLIDLLLPFDLPFDGHLDHDP